MTFGGDDVTAFRLRIDLKFKAKHDERDAMHFSGVSL